MMYLDTNAISKVWCLVYMLFEFECTSLSRSLKLAIPIWTGFIHCGKMWYFSIFSWVLHWSHLILEAPSVKLLICKACLTTSAICLALSWGACGNSVPFTVSIFTTQNKMSLSLTLLCIMPEALRRNSPSFFFYFFSPATQEQKAQVNINTVFIFKYIQLY